MLQALTQVKIKADDADMK